MKSPAGYLRPFLDGTGYLYGVGDDPRTLSELAMARLSYELRSIPEWWTSYKKADFKRSKMRKASSKRWRLGPHNTAVTLTAKQIEYVFDELAGYAALRDMSSGAQISCFDRIWEADSLVKTAEHSVLLDSIQFLRDRSHHSWGQPPYDSLLLDPCRYSFVSGRTLTKGPIAQESPDHYIVSKRFTALPTQISVSSEGQQANCLSYINGIDPQLPDVYAAFEAILSRFVTMFEHVLTELHRTNPLPHRIKGPYRYCEWDEPDPPEDSGDDEEVDQFLQEFEYWTMNRPVKLPDVPDGGYNGDLPRRVHKVSLAGRNIQVFFKIFDVHLTSGQSAIPASDWAVEGMKNERIVVCALYVCIAENVSANISFRMAVTSPRGFLEGDVGATLRTWGMEDRDPCNQHIGSVTLAAGRSIAFPNIYQHRLSSIRLTDASREGRVTIMWMYLADPDASPTLSTARVPPQQVDWVYRALVDSLDRRLPTELVRRIADSVDSLMTEEEADAYQHEMHAEWIQFQKKNNSKYFSLPFDIWNP